MGRGRVVWGQSLSEVLRAECPADFVSEKPLLYTHRQSADMDIYFVSNQRPEEVVTNVSFRVQGGSRSCGGPSWDGAQEGASHRLPPPQPVCRCNFSRTVRCLWSSANSLRTKDRVVAVQKRNGKAGCTDISGSLTRPVSTSTAKHVRDNFTLAVWAKPTADTTLPEEANAGAGTLGVPRNDAVFPQHGNLFGAGTHAGSGIAIGRNGVCVLEHGAAYFAPLLVRPVKRRDWTHVAVVYRDGQPSLYLNGKLIRSGLKSQYTVHPTTASGGGGPFIGEMGAIEMVPRALAAADVVSLMDSMSRPGTRPAGSVIQVIHTGQQGLVVEASEAGEYVLEMADGTRQSVRVDAVPDSIAITGPWQVRFDPRWGGPQQIVFEDLVDWTKRPEDGIRHYSGTATYSSTFQLPKSAQPGQRLWLDLGNVRDLATVRVNGQALGTLWMARGELIFPR